METRREINIDDIEILDNSRIRFDEKELASLMADIKSRGLLQKIRVFYDQKDSKYILMFGHRRLEACRRLGYKTISADCIEGEEFDFVRFLTDNLAENIQRKELLPVEVARVVSILRDKGLNDSEICISTGIPKKRVVGAVSQISKVPDKYKSLIQYHNPRSNINKGVGVTVMDAITNQAFGRNEKEVAQMIEYAHKNEVTIREIHLLKKLMSSGMTFDKAVKGLDQYDTFSIQLIMSKEERGKYTHKSPTEIIKGIVSGEIEYNKKLIY